MFKVLKVFLLFPCLSKGNPGPSSHHPSEDLHYYGANTVLAIMVGTQNTPTTGITQSYPQPQHNLVSNLKLILRLG